MKTVGIDLWEGQARGAQQNCATMMSRAAVVMPRTARDLFLANYGKLAQRCREVEEPGLAVVAIDDRTGRAAGLVRLCARVERHVAAIVGRHDACDLYLTGCERLSLRHLAIVLDPVTSWKAGDKGIRFHVLDLRTSDGFTDEHGRQLRGLVCEGPAILRVGGHTLFLLPLGDPTDFPEAPEDAWACLPERVYFDEVDHFAQGTQAKLQAIPRGVPIGTQLGAPVTRRSSVMMRTHGPRDTHVGLVESGDVAGVLELIGPSFRSTIRMGAEALKDGVLLGRYARCDGANGLADDNSLSRVHALLIQMGDTLLVVDTASSNGTWENGEAPRSRVFALDTSTTELVLGKHTRVRWRWAS